MNEGWILVLGSLRKAVWGFGSGVGVVLRVGVMGKVDMRFGARSSRWVVWIGFESGLGGGDWWEEVVFWAVLVVGVVVGGVGVGLFSI